VCELPKKTFALRPYQQDALTQIRTLYSSLQKKVLLHLPTGGGKTVIFCQVLKGAHQKGKHAIMVVRGRKLVDQASIRLDREGVEHGVMMAGHKRFAPMFPIQICSIDTLRARKLRPKADIIVIDEAHLATSESYVEFFKDYPDAYYLPVTATPYTDKSLRHMADHVVKPTTVMELIEDGFLVEPKYFAPNLPDLSKVKTTNTSEGKDYNNKQLSEVMEDGTLIGDIGYHWLNLAAGRPTIAFCVSVNHSKKLVESLLQRGIRAEHVDANSSDWERQEAINRLERGDLDIISNVGILCTGVDIPCLSCIIMARPTKSYNLYIQQAGRGTRPDEGKEDFIVLDHSGNVLRHGFITEEREANLDEDDGKKKKKAERSPTQCEDCFAIYYGKKCPSCGAEKESNGKEFAVIDGNLKEMKPEDFDPVLKDLKEWKKVRKAKGYKRGWIYHQIKEKYGEETAQKYYKRGGRPSGGFSGITREDSQRNANLTGMPAVLPSLAK